MAFTVRKNILDQIVYRMGTLSQIVTVTSRRKTDDNPYEPDECPALNIYFGETQKEEQISHDEHHQTIILELFATTRSGDDYSENIFPAIADMILANQRWGGYADGSGSPSIDAGEVYEVGDLISIGTLSFVVHYTTEKGKL